MKTKHRKDCCRSCNKPYIDHLGVQGTCAALLEWRACAIALAFTLREHILPSKKPEAMKQYERLIMKH